MSPALVVVLLALLLGIQPITTDVYLPALPSLQQDLGASMAQVQMTFAALLLSFGISQLVWGPLSDRFGRKPILLWGMGAYVLASVACVLAPSMALLIAARTAQGAAKDYLKPKRDVNNPATAPIFHRAMDYMDLLY